MTEKLCAGWPKRLRVLFPFIAVLAIVLAGFAFVQSPVARYQYYPQLIRPTFNFSGEIDILALGRSGFMTMFNSDKFAAALRQETGGGSTIVDVSKNWSGADTHYLQLRDISNRLRIKNAIVQIYPDVAREHPKFHELATFPDLVEGSLAYQGQGLAWRLYRAYTLAVKKVREVSTRLLGGTFVWFDLAGGQPVVTHDVHPSANQQADAKVAKWAKAVGVDWKSKPPRTWLFNSDFDARNRYYYRKIVALAKEKGIRLIFLYYPELYDAELGSDFVRALSAYYGNTPVVYPRAADLEWLYRNGYADHGHSNQAGQDYAASVYVRQLVPLLSN